MSKTKVYIDGQAGTTGLQIFDRIGAREDLELMRIDEDKRHDNEERRKFLNAADIVFLCLPDAGAREAVSLIDNPNVRVIDASTAHRTADGWTYGFPELSADQRAAIASSRRVANPGCHATGFISCAAPLIRMGIVPVFYPLTCFSLTGYSGGGKKMIANYEAADKAQPLYAPGIYGLTLKHKHIPEMVKVCGLEAPPVFLPVVDDYYKGMATTIMLHNRLLPGAPTAQGSDPNSLIHSSPVASSMPSMMFMFWTAAPEAPLPRLSKRAVTLVWPSWPQTTIFKWFVPASSLA